jgi:hypothetical protein
MPAFHGLTLPRQNPARPGQPSGTRTPAGNRRGGPASGVVSSGGAAYRLQEAAVEEEGRGPPLRRDQGRGGGAGAAIRGRAPRHGGPPRREDAPHRGRRCTSVRADVGAAELASGGRRRCARVGEERCVGEGRRLRDEDAHR